MNGTFEHPGRQSGVGELVWKRSEASPRKRVRIIGQVVEKTVCLFWPKSNTHTHTYKERLREGERARESNGARKVHFKINVQASH